MAAQYKLQKSANGQFFFSLLAGNNEKILASEQYKAKDSALKGIESVKANSPNDARYERKTSSDGKFYFVLKAANGEPIGRSEMYNSERNMEKGIEAVKRVGPTAEVNDLTSE